MSNIWFTADTHFGHSNILRYCERPFDNIGEHDLALIDNWNSCVRPGDTVFHLGDLALASKGRLKSIIERLNGQITLLLGNHDKQSARHYLDLGIKDVLQSKLVMIGKRYVVLNHYPFGCPGTTTRLPPVRLIDPGVPFLHGHTHSKERIRHRSADSLCLGPGVYDECEQQLEINVGVDAWDYKPVSQKQIQNIISYLWKEGLDD